MNSNFHEIFDQLEQVFTSLLCFFLMFNNQKKSDWLEIILGLAVLHLVIGSGEQDIKIYKK